MEVNKKFDREEFEKHLIKDDDISLTSCCGRKYYKTKKHMKCAGCKKIVTNDIVARGVMKGIDAMMKEKEEREIGEGWEEHEGTREEAFDSWVEVMEEREQPEVCNPEDKDSETKDS